MNMSNTNLSEEKKTTNETQNSINNTSYTSQQFNKIQNKKHKKNKKSKHDKHAFTGNNNNHINISNNSVSNSNSTSSNTNSGLVANVPAPGASVNAHPVSANTSNSAVTSTTTVKASPNNSASSGSNRSYQPPHLEKYTDYKKNDNKTVEPKSRKKRSKEKKSGSKKKIIIILIIVIILAILSFIFGLITSQSNKIISGITVNGVDISNLSKESADMKLNLALKANGEDEITLKNGEYTKTISLKDIDFEYDIQKTVDAAFAVGRSEGNIFSNNFKVISTFFSKKNINPNVKYNESKLNDLINTLNEEIPDRAIPSGYEIEDTNLNVKPGTSGYLVSKEEFTAKLINSIIYNSNTIDIPTKKVEAEEIDIDKIYASVHKDPVDASFTQDPFEIHREQDGIDFAISIEEAKELAKQHPEGFTIPLKITPPAVTVKNLPQEAFPNQLGTYTTSYASSSANRANNVDLAAEAINGLVLMPGEEFSYNQSVDQRTPARGYKQAGVYVNGKVETDYGGGICQVSSTLYNAVLLADLEVTARTNHYFYPGYVPVGLDATVSWGAPDFRFKNNKDFPIRISTHTANRELEVSIYGVKKNDEYEVKIVSYTTGYIGPGTEYQDDSSLPAGATRVVSGGSSGLRSEAYKVYMKDGNEVSRTLISADTYHPHNQVVARGTGAAETPSEPSAPSQEQSAPAQQEESSVIVTTETPSSNEAESNE